MLPGSSGAALRRALLLLPVLVPGAASGAHAQSQPVRAPLHVSSVPPLLHAGSNVAIGAGAAAWHAWRTGHPVGRAVWRGAIGGGVMAGGFVLGGTRWPASRALGLQVVSLGASAARNAGRDAPLWSQLTLPVFPLIVEVERAPRMRPRMRVRASVAALAGLGAHVASGGMQADWAQTLSAGSLVLRTTSESFHRGVECPPDLACLRAGVHRRGVVAYRSATGDLPAEARTLRHEAMHVAQHGRDLVLFGVSTSEAMAARTGRVGRWVNRALVVDVVLPLRSLDLLSSRVMGSEYHSWYELEARTYAPGSAAGFVSNPVPLTRQRSGRLFVPR